jgi:hypothetical protein
MTLRRAALRRCVEQQPAHRDSLPPGRTQVRGAAQEGGVVIGERGLSTAAL